MIEGSNILVGKMTSYHCGSSDELIFHSLPYPTTAHHSGLSSVITGPQRSELQRLLILSAVLEESFRIRLLIKHYVLSSGSKGF